MGYDDNTHDNNVDFPDKESLFSRLCVGWDDGMGGRVVPVNWFDSPGEKVR